jgi:hypothetical protein
MIPVRRDPTATEEKVIEHVPIERVVEELATIAPNDKEIEMPDLNVTIEASSPETFPIKKMETYPEVLIVSYSEIK